MVPDNPSPKPHPLLPVGEDAPAYAAVLAAFELAVANATRTAHLQLLGLMSPPAGDPVSELASRTAEVSAASERRAGQLPAIPLSHEEHVALLTLDLLTRAGAIRPAPRERKVL